MKKFRSILSKGNRHETLVLFPHLEHLFQALEQTSASWEHLSVSWEQTSGNSF